jgi:hypothetical protein
VQTVPYCLLLRPPENLEPIAKALNVPLKELFDFEKTRYLPPPPPLPTTEARRVVKKLK